MDKEMVFDFVRATRHTSEGEPGPSPDVVNHATTTFEEDRHAEFIYDEVPYDAIIEFKHLDFGKVVEVVSEGGEFLQHAHDWTGKLLFTVTYDGAPEAPLTAQIYLTSEAKGQAPVTATSLHFK